MSPAIRQAFANTVSLTVTVLILLIIANAVQASASPGGDFDFSATSCPSGRPYAGRSRRTRPT